MSELPRFVECPTPSVYCDGRPLFVDFETTNLDKGTALNPDNRLVLAGWELSGDRYRTSDAGTYGQEELLRDVERADFLVAHNAKFELQWLARAGLDLHNVIVYDTMLAEYVIGGNRWVTANLSLDDCLSRHGLPAKVGLVARMIKAGICPSEIPRPWLEKYLRRDVAALRDLMGRQLACMQNTRLLPVVYARCLLTPVLADMEQHGMYLDATRVLPLLKEQEARHAELELRLNTLAAGVNLNSPQQKAAFLYDTLGFHEPTKGRGRFKEPDRTATGGRRTDADTIDGFVAKTEEQTEFLTLFVEERETSNALTKYLRKFGSCCVEAGGLIHAAFNQTQTATHRLSSSGRKYKVQFQNFPRAYKKLVRAEEGKLVGEVDGSQLEFRVGGHLGKDPAIRADVVSGADVHTVTAQTLTKHGQETGRQDAKEHTFKPLYGGRSGTDAERAYYELFRNKYPAIVAAQQRWIEQVLANKKLETEWGLVYYWPDTRLDRSGYVTNTPSICNYPVQGFATAEIIPIALVCMWHRIHRRKLTMRLVNTVHDSIIAYLPPEEADAFHELSRQCLIADVSLVLRALYNIELFVPLGCAVKVGSHWGTGSETKYEEPIK